MQKVLKCQITQEVFKDYVLTADGVSYKQEAITQWLVMTNCYGQLNDTLPAIGVTLMVKILTNNINLWQII